MLSPILSFAQKLQQGGPLRRGRLTLLDVSISQASVQGIEAPVSLDPQDSTHLLREVIAHGGDAVQIECDFEPSHRVVQLHLMVRPDLVDRLLRNGELPVEEALIHLARSVWRDARIPTDYSHYQTNAPECVQVQECVRWKEDEFPLFAHQRATVDWMRHFESNVPHTFGYSGNLKITDEWYLDTENETFTTDASPREAQLAGGICADGMGTGKTATALRLVVETLGREPPQTSATQSRYVSDATLIILPLNLVSQWQGEISKFVHLDRFRVVWMVQGKDVRATTLQDLCQSADVVITTSYFLRASKPYTEMVDACLGGSGAISRAKTRAALSSWSRHPDRTEPVLEAIHWKRVIVDEIHQTFESPRDLRQLKLFHTQMLWGLTATPTLDSDHAQHLYLLLRREKAHHPNLLSQLIAHSVRGTVARHVVEPSRSLELVQLSGEERMHLNCSTNAEIGKIIRTCTFVPEAADGGTGGGDASVEEQFRQAQSRTLQTLCAKVEGHQRSVRIFERAGAELELEVQRLAEECADGSADECVAMQAEIARAACETHSRDLAVARSLLDAEQTKLLRHKASEQFVIERLSSLRAHNETCPVCHTRPCELITSCSHMFCGQCADSFLRTHGVCPLCSLPLGEFTRVAGVGGIGTKFTRIGELVLSISEPIILFVQWKAMMRGTRSFLRNLPARVLTLDGNAAQRSTILAEFMSGGVLLLCLEESFAGLHLAHVRHIIFAHAIVGDRNKVALLESQAIARCVRHGQTRQVQVHSFVVADCEEEDLYHRTHA